MNTTHPAWPSAKSRLTVIRNGLNLSDKLVVRTKSDIHVIEQQTIAYLESSSNYCTVFYGDNNKILVSKTLGHLSKQLQPRFIRIHSRYIVNTDNIIKIDLKNNRVYMKHGSDLPISRSRKKALLEPYKSQQND